MLLVGVIAADGRESMSAYRDELVLQFARLRAPVDFSILDYQASSASANGLRFARYVRYPLAVRRACATVDIVHVVDQGYGHLVWFTHKPSVVTVHDLIPLVRWRGGIPATSRGRLPFLNLLSSKSLRRARRVLVDSRATGRDAVAYAGVHPACIRVAPLGLRSQFDVAKSGPPRDTEPPRRRGMVMLSGTDNFYKNLRRSLEAIALLVREGMDIGVLKPGRVEPSFLRDAAELGLTSRLQMPGFVQEADLPSLYRSADCLLFPSLYEGFGWPPLEAMACGVPVVASAVGALDDLAGGAYLRVDPLDVNGIAAAVRLALSDDQIRQSLLAAGLHVASQLSWTEAVNQTLAAYRDLIPGVA